MSMPQTNRRKRGGDSADSRENSLRDEQGSPAKVRDHRQMSSRIGIAKGAVSASFKDVLQEVSSDTAKRGYNQ